MAVCISGDIFHYKSPLAYHPLDINQLVDYFSFYRYPIVMIPGNHDLPSSSVDQYKSSPYSILVQLSPNIHTVDISDPFAPIFSYIERNSLGQPTHLYRFFGLPYYPLKDSINALAELNTHLTSESNVINICLTHIDAIPDSSVPLHYEVISQYQLSQLAPKVHCFLQGHIHLSFPPINLQPNIPLNNTDHQLIISKPWSLGRVVKDYFNTTDILMHQHVPSYSLITFTPSTNPIVGQASNYPQPLISIEYKSLSTFKPSKEIFKEQSLKEEVEGSNQVNSFVQQLQDRFGDQALAIQTPEDMMNQLPSTVKSTISEYLQKVG